MSRETGVLGDFEIFLSKSGTIPDDKSTERTYLDWAKRFFVHIQEIKDYFSISP